MARGEGRSTKCVRRIGSLFDGRFVDDPGQQRSVSTNVIVCAVNRCRNGPRHRGALTSLSIAAVDADAQHPIPQSRIQGLSCLCVVHAAHDAAVVVLQDRITARDRRQRTHRFE